jgi:hypothetical protein
MNENIKEQIELGFKGKVIAFFLILFGAYAIIWAIIEPLALDWITENKASWRLALIISTLLITIYAFIKFFPKKILEEFGFEPSNTNLQTSMISSKNPEIKIESDGFLGKVFFLDGKNGTDEMDWHLKPSAHKALFFTFVYLPDKNMTFYLRIILVSKDRSEHKYGWLRFDANLPLPQKFKGQEEIGYPITATNHDNYLKTIVNIKKAVKDTFGKGGWQYDKTILFRIRGNGRVKNVTLRQ